MQYTYWDYFRNTVGYNWDWRIEHIPAAAPLTVSCRATDVDLQTRRAPGASDHCVLWAEFQ